MFEETRGIMGSCKLNDMQYNGGEGLGRQTKRDKRQTIVDKHKKKIRSNMNPNKTEDELHYGIGHVTPTRQRMNSTMVSVMLLQQDRG